MLCRKDVRPLVRGLGTTGRGWQPAKAFFSFSPGNCLRCKKRAKAHSPGYFHAHPRVPFIVSGFPACASRRARPPAYKTWTRGETPRLQKLPPSGGMGFPACATRGGWRGLDRFNMGWRASFPRHRGRGRARVRRWKRRRRRHCPRARDRCGGRRPGGLRCRRPRRPTCPRRPAV